MDLTEVNAEALFFTTPAFDFDVGATATAVYRESTPTKELPLS